MKTLEEILYDATGMLSENHPSIIEAMKEYAKEFAKQALMLAKERMEYEYSDYEETADFTLILSEENLPDLH